MTHDPNPDLGDSLAGSVFSHSSIQLVMDDAYADDKRLALRVVLSSDTSTRISSLC